MDYYLIFGMVVVALIALYGIYKSIQKDAEARQKPLNELNINIVKLSENINAMNQRDIARDKQIEKHDKKFDKLEDRFYEAEHTLSNHETRIKSLEHKGAN